MAGVTITNFSKIKVIKLVTNNLDCFAAVIDWRYSMCTSNARVLAASVALSGGTVRVQVQ